MTSGRFAYAIVAALFLLSLPLGAAPILLGVSGDDFGAPVRLNELDPMTSSATPIVDMGDGSTGFVGGLAYHAPDSSYYVVGSNFLGESSLYRFTDPSSLTPVVMLGFGFVGGLASDGTLLYVMSDDGFGNPTISSIDLGTNTVTPLFSVGMGQSFGGLTYHSGLGQIFGLATDLNGDSSLVSVDLGGMSAAVVQILGQGFNGGLAYDAGQDLFYMLGSDSFGSSTLYSYRIGDQGPTPVFDPGFGFMFSGLTVGASVDTAVPEPSTWTLLTVGVLALAAFRKRR